MPPWRPGGPRNLATKATRHWQRANRNRNGSATARASAGNFVACRLAADRQSRWRWPPRWGGFLFFSWRRAACRCAAASRRIGNSSTSTRSSHRTSRRRTAAYRSGNTAEVSLRGSSRCGGAYNLNSRHLSRRRRAFHGRLPYVTPAAPTWPTQREDSRCPSRSPSRRRGRIISRRTALSRIRSKHWWRVYTFLARCTRERSNEWWLFNYDDWYSIITLPRIAVNAQRLFSYWYFSRTR